MAAQWLVWLVVSGALVSTGAVIGEGACRVGCTVDAPAVPLGIVGCPSGASVVHPVTAASKTPGNMRNTWDILFNSDRVRR